MQEYDKINNVSNEFIGIQSNEIKYNNIKITVNGHSNKLIFEKNVTLLIQEYQSLVIIFVKNWSQCYC